MQKRSDYQDEKLLNEIVGSVGDATLRGLMAVAHVSSFAEAMTWWRGWGSLAYLRKEYVADAAADWRAIAPKRYQLLLDAVESVPTKAVQAPGYTYDRVANRYRNTATGRYVSFQQIYNLIDSMGTGRLEVMERLTHEMHSGALSPAAWLLSMQHELVRAHLHNAALGAGGWLQLTTNDYQRVDRVLREEMVRMERFGQDIRAGRVVSEAQLRNRLGMYLGTARTQYFNAIRPPRPQPGQVALERRILGHADHCSLCIYLAMLGWQPHGTLPVPGEGVEWWEEDQCLSNCKCNLFRLTLPQEEADALVTQRPIRPLKSFDADLFLEMVGKAWDESKHPRHEAGDERGGEFAPKGGGGGKVASRVLDTIKKAKPGLSDDAVQMYMDAMSLDKDRFVQYAKRLGIQDPESMADDFFVEQKEISRANALDKWNFQLENTMKDPRGGVYHHSEATQSVFDIASKERKESSLSELAKTMSEKFGSKLSAYQGIEQDEYAAAIKQVKELLNVAESIPSIAKVMKEKVKGVRFLDSNRGTALASWNFTENTIDVYAGKRIDVSSWIHELGHAAETYLPAGVITETFDKGKRVSGYAWGNYSEDFAETFASIAGGRLGEVSDVVPEKVKIFKKYLPWLTGGKQ